MVGSALKIGCNNALNGDTYGHYREAEICQTKHHWWWKTNTVFDILDVTSRHFGSFMFLEEDHYLLPDTIHIWKLMNEYRIQSVIPSIFLFQLIFFNYQKKVSKVFCHYFGFIFAFI